jgi:hypothetical protein
VFSGAVAPDAGFWLWLEALKKTEEPGGLPKVIHIERVLSENDCDFAGEANANGEKVVAQGHVIRQADGNLKMSSRSHPANVGCCVFPLSPNLITGETWKPLQ